VRANCSRCKALHLFAAAPPPDFLCLHCAADALSLDTATSPQGVYVPPDATEADAISKAVSCFGCRTLVIRVTPDVLVSDGLLKETPRVPKGSASRYSRPARVPPPPPPPATCHICHRCAGYGGGPWKLPAQFGFNSYLLQLQFAQHLYDQAERDVTGWKVRGDLRWFVDSEREPGEVPISEMIVNRLAAALKLSAPDVQKLLIGFSPGIREVEKVDYLPAGMVHPDVKKQLARGRARMRKFQDDE
jgi:hypothetical protein